MTSCCTPAGPLAGASDEQMARWFAPSGPQSRRLDLWAANRDHLIGAGLHEEDIHVSRLCTKTHRDVFESYRADGEGAGRMAALIRVPAGPIADAS